MFAVYRRELRSYFSGMFGYIYLAFYLLFAGLFVSVLCLYGGSSSIEVSYGYTSFVFLLSVPFLSLRGFSDERRLKTDLLLMTLPLQPYQIVGGKYLAMITLTGIGQLLGFSQIIILSFYGSIRWQTAVAATVAYFLCGCALTAIGLFLSSLTGSILISALTVFAAMLGIYFLPDLILLLPTTAVGSFLVLTVMLLLVGICAGLVTRSAAVFAICTSLLLSCNLALLLFGEGIMEGLSAQIFRALSVTEQLSDFTTFGIFNLQGIVYFVGTALLFVYFTTLSVGKRRWS